MDRHAVRQVTLVAVLTLASVPAQGVLITFEQLPDGTPIQNDPNVCGEVTFDSFRPWGVLFTPADDAELNIGTTWVKCLSRWNRLQRCNPWTGTLDITFVVPGTNVSTVVDSILFSVLTQATPVSNNRINTYNAEGELIHTWTMPPSFCYEPPQYWSHYHFSAAGQIARVECVLVRAGIDDLHVVGLTTAVEGGTWGGVKSFYRDATR